ncbi:hypothetical protein CYMTET_56110 [Cymbomonas tetramitiformis]|uniref:Uncharacterized protein n=1 Tax=Cymbomonas tetramitiformis TaxID=36881 RepID=A0AAE0EMN9_9CHLO|nr:hypothetical protein CYMTET_56110 [Cymbomonas tetramitiformis]
MSKAAVFIWRPDTATWIARITVSRDQGACIIVSRDQGARITVSRDQGTRITVSRDQGARITVSRDQGARITVSRDQCALITVSRDQGARITVSRDQCARITVSRDQGARITVSRDQGACITVSRDQGTRITVSRDQGTLITVSRDQGARITVSRDQGARITVSRDQGARQTPPARIKAPHHCQPWIKAPASLSAVIKAPASLSAVIKAPRITVSRDQGARITAPASLLGRINARITVSRDQGACIIVSRDQGARITVSRDQGTRITVSRDQGARITVSRDQGARITDTEEGREALQTLLAWAVHVTKERHLAHIILGTTPTFIPNVLYAFRDIQSCVRITEVGDLPLDSARTYIRERAAELRSRQTDQATPGVTRRTAEGVRADVDAAHIPELGRTSGRTSAEDCDAQHIGCASHTEDLTDAPRGCISADDTEILLEVLGGRVCDIDKALESVTSGTSHSIPEALGMMVGNLRARILASFTQMNPGKDRPAHTHTRADEEDDEDDDDEYLDPLKRKYSLLTSIAHGDDELKPDSWHPWCPLKLWETMERLVVSKGNALPYHELCSSVFDGDESEMQALIENDILGLHFGKPKSLGQGLAGLDYMYITAFSPLALSVFKVLVQDPQLIQMMSLKRQQILKQEMQKQLLEQKQVLQEASVRVSQQKVELLQTIKIWRELETSSSMEENVQMVSHLKKLKESVISMENQMIESQNRLDHDLKTFKQKGGR